MSEFDNSRFISTETQTIVGCLSRHPSSSPLECRYFYIAERESEVLDCEEYLRWEKEVAEGDETTFRNVMMERYYHKICELGPFKTIEIFGSQRYALKSIYPNYDTSGESRSVNETIVPTRVGDFDPLTSGYVYVTTSPITALFHNMGAYAATRTPFSRYAIRSEDGAPVFNVCVLLPDSGYGLGEFYESCFDMDHIIPEREHAELLQLRSKAGRLLLQLEEKQ